MNFELNETQLRFQEQMRILCKKEIAPGADLIDQAGQAKSERMMKENIKKLGSIGYLECLQNGRDFLKIISAGEELAKTCLSTYLTSEISASICGRIINETGTPEQKGIYSVGIREGSKIGGCCVNQSAKMEVNAAWNGSSWLLNGTSEWMGNAPLADFLIVWVRDADSGRMMVFLVDGGADGMTITPAYDKLGAKGYPVSGVRFESCCLSDDRMLGGPDHATEIIERVTDLQKWAITVGSLGIAVASMQEGIGHYKKNKKQLTQMKGFRFADMWVLTDIGRLLLQQAAWAKENSDYEAKVKASCAAAFMTDAVSKVSNWVIELLGKDFYQNNKAGRLYRDIGFLMTSGRSSENHRDDIAEHILSNIQ